MTSFVENPFAKFNKELLITWFLMSVTTRNKSCKYIYTNIKLFTYVKYVLNQIYMQNLT